MRALQFFAKSNRSDNLLHIETDGCIVNIRVGLTDSNGRAVTRVDIIPDDEQRGGDGQGHIWKPKPASSCVTRVVRVKED